MITVVVVVVVVVVAVYDLATCIAVELQLNGLEIGIGKFTDQKYFDARFTI